MSCCGGRRREARASGTQAAPAAAGDRAGAGLPPLSPRAPAAIVAPTDVVYLGDTAVVMRGAVSGLTYVFDAGRAPVGVDARDVADLVATGRFAHGRR